MCAGSCFRLKYPCSFIASPCLLGFVTRTRGIVSLLTQTRENGRGPRFRVHDQASGSVQFPCGTRGHTLLPPQRRFHHAGLSRRCGRHILGTGFVTNTNKEGTKTKFLWRTYSAIPELRFSEGQILLTGHAWKKFEGALRPPPV